jgi:uncharacterized phiE125 gp8 family phage protein
MSALDLYKDSGAVKDCLVVEAHYVNQYLEIPECSNGDNTVLDDMIYSAQCYFELYTRRILTQRTFTLKISTWGCLKEIMRSPLVSVSQVKYKDSDGADQIVDASLYYITEQEYYSCLMYDEDFTFPTLLNRPHSIEITFLAGMLDCDTLPEDTPDDIKVAIMELVTAINENRGCPCNSSMLSPTAKSIMNKYKIYGI